MKLTVFLLPDSGPISPVDLDLRDIFATLTPPRPADGLTAGQVQRLCDAIRKRYPGVRPESNLQGLARIYANFGHADRFDGAVLRMAGEIAAAPDTGPTSVKAVAEQIDRRDAEIRRLQGDLRRERGAREARERDLSEVTGQLEVVVRDLETLREARDAAQQALSRARHEREAAQRRAGNLEETVAARDREIEALRAERRPADPAHASHPMLD